MNSKRKLLNSSNVIVGLWLLAMFTIFPLIYNNFYYDILQTKFYTVVIADSAVALKPFLTM